MNAEKLKTIVLEALDDLKAQEIVVIDVRDKSSFTDMMIIATGSSQRQVKSLADNVSMKSKASGILPIGIEGADVGDWVLVDLGDIVVHVMLAQVRRFYQLEKLWSVSEDEPLDDTE
ncbi:MAG TPA: ribosome silencing factor [Gammaproteobacteria bacterium]|nr:ribosome silencing factor [Gammaproteobacteria bacterium]